MQKLIIIRGIPGSGKSTYSNKLRAHLIKFGYDPNDIIQCEADMYFEDEEGNYNWNPELLGKAHKFCFEECKRALAAHKIAIVSNTFVDRKSIKKYAKLAEEMNAELEVYHCTGKYQNVHNVPKETVENMLSNIKPWDGEMFV